MQPAIMEIGDDPRIVCRRAILNTLSRGPFPVARMFETCRKRYGLTRKQVLAEARWFNLSIETVDGELCFRKPDVLVALPTWDYRQRRHHQQAATGPSAA
jgi:hypothetical protein